MGYREDFQQVLYNNVEIQSKVDSKIVGGDLVYFIFSGQVLPHFVSARKKSVNHYQINNLNGGLNYGQVTYAINCRGPNEVEAFELQKVVFNEINREGEGDIFKVCSALPAIPPIDETDNWNCPIDIILKFKNLEG